MLTTVQTILLAALLVVLMAGMGASLTMNDFHEVLRRPRGPLIGLLSQYGWMPLIAFGLCKVLGLPDDLAISLIVVGCTPGGTTSNLFTYFAGADVALSVSMTALSTIAAVVLMPLTLYVYASGYASAGLKIPYGNITTTLAVMLVPLALGMWCGRAAGGGEGGRAGRRGRGARGARAADRHRAVQQHGDADGDHRDDVRGGARARGAGLWLRLARGACGGARVAQRRAVAFETGIQNSPLALGILIASFPASSRRACCGCRCCTRCWC
jgi:predicted Na+-dependent transporter